VAERASTWIVRTAIPRDAPVIAAMRRDYFVKQVGSTGPVEPGFVERLTPLVAQAISDPDQALWVAETPASRQIVSVAWVKLVLKVPWPGQWESRWGYVTNVYTRPDYRGQGAGTRIIEAIQQWAHERGLEFLILWPSEQSVDWYLRLGVRHPSDVLLWPIHPES
jgi:GNAT superfamily N-acetyltransferase